MGSWREAVALSLLFQYENICILTSVLIMHIFVMSLHLNIPSFHVFFVLSTCSIVSLSAIFGLSIFNHSISSSFWLIVYVSLPFFCLVCKLQCTPWTHHCVSSRNSKSSHIEFRNATTVYFHPFHFPFFILILSYILEATQHIIFPFFFHFYFIIHMCIQGLVHFFPLPPPPPLPPTPPPPSPPSIEKEF
jgi:hypothetical protein